MNNTSTQQHHPRYMNATNSSTNKQQSKYKYTSSPFKTLLHHKIIINEQPYNIKHIKHNNDNNNAHVNVTFAQKFVNKPNIKRKNKDNFEGGIGMFMYTNAKRKIRHYSYDYNNSVCTARVLNPLLNEETLNCKVKFYKGRVNRKNIGEGGGLKCLFDRTPSKFFNKGKKRCLTQERKENEIFSDKFLYDKSVGIVKGKKRRHNEESVGLSSGLNLKNEDWGWGKGKKRVLPLSDRNSTDDLFFN